MMKAFTGWRSSDLSGITIKLGLRETACGGWLVRFWDGKTGKNKWSGWVQLPMLAERYAHLCVVRLIARVRKLAAGAEAGVVQVRDDNGKETDDFPLFAYNDKNEVLWPLSEKTIGKKVKTDMELVLGEDTTHTAHDFRHAVASQLADMAVAEKTISEHLQVSWNTIKKTYAVPVEREFKLPVECLKAADSVVHKLLIPWIHSRAVEGGRCDCAGVLSNLQ